MTFGTGMRRNRWFWSTRRGRAARRKLLLQANRNGFFYVLDRTNGKLLLGKPFVNKLTWAKEIGADGRPVRNPDQDPTEKGTKICPAVLGATNWWSAAFDNLRRPLLHSDDRKLR